MPGLPRGWIKVAPEDFVVEELPAYAASGSGEHLFVRFTKRGLTTDDAVRALAQGAGVRARDVGVAGLKDKVAVTTQTVSLPVPRGERDAFDDRVRGLAIPGVVIHEAKRHGNKLRTGHLSGNRFDIVVRGLDPAVVDAVAGELERVGREGVPNAFGAQRFGRDKDNAERALAWLTGKGQGSRDPRQRRFLWSALQSALFNEVLDRRVAEGTWRTPLQGDLLKKSDTGGIFLCQEEAVDRDRAERGEVSPTGPMFGAEMSSPEGHPAELERAVFEERLGGGFDLESLKSLGEGTRRVMRVVVEGMTVRRLDGPHPGEPPPGREQLAGLRVSFVLPKGAYATTVLGAAVALEAETSPSPADTTALWEGRSTVPGEKDPE
jgi:tRNA pseudouridine13 synthase